ncbi:MAG: helix-turn-helix domain-containing protein, partial [Phycisphaerales bacterium]|nr:helix-turn-helix domain-containing protein [Phycisphaerales bacterium]
FNCTYLQIGYTKLFNPISYQLERSKKRLGQLDVAIPGITRKAQTTQLNELVEDQLIVRTSYAESKPRVDYSLTGKGKELLPILNSIAKWGKYLVQS